MEFKPHLYQSYCLQRIYDTPKIGLFLDMGLGKTITTLTAIRELKYNRFQVRNVLVIAPKKVAEGTWSKESAKWEHTKLLRISKVLGSKQKRLQALTTPADIYIINRENVAWLVDYYRNAWPFDMVVVDESSSFKSHKSQRFKSLSLVSSKINRMILLTGTPSPNSLEDLWSQIYLLDGGKRLGERFTHFRDRFFEPGDRSRDRIYNYNPKFGSEQAISDKISDICISMKAEDYLTLPECVYQEIPVILDSKARRAYDELETQMVLELPEEEEISVTSAAALSTKLLQLSNGALYDETHEAHEIHNCKIEAFLELVESLQGKSLLVFYQFQHDKERILQALSKSKLRIHELKTAQDETDWNNGKIDILLAHPASAAYGLNLQDGGCHICWFGLTWNFEQYSQANKRLHRQGQKHTVFIHHLVCQNTRDEDVMKALDAKDNMQEMVMSSLKARIEKAKKRSKK